MIGFYALCALATIGGMWVACLLLWIALLLVSWVSYKRTVRRLVKQYEAARLRDPHPRILNERR